MRTPIRHLLPSKELLMASSTLFSKLAAIRHRTMALTEPLLEEDCCVQSMPEASPVKWHLGHVSWFFENFVLRHYEKPFRPFHEIFLTMFSSYDVSGQTHPDPKRGLFTRPSLAVTRDYGRDVLERMGEVLDRQPDDKMLSMLAVLGMHHEQQHQELILSDIKHLLSQNPLDPGYHQPEVMRNAPEGAAPPLEWRRFDGGLVEIGYEGDGFSYDNESPRHKQYLQPYQLASRLVTNSEYLRFMEAGGYENPTLWLSEGWNWIKENGRSHPLYWRKDMKARTDSWQEFTLSGPMPLEGDLPVIHISFYEADAFARWSDARLPTEAEWENAAAGQPIEGCFADNNRFHPASAGAMEPADKNRLPQLYGDAWEWTQSSYSPYPGYNPARPNEEEPMSKVWNEAVGEYNSRSMVNQYVLRGGSCIIPRERIRASFRNFFPASTCWQFSGIRLARDA
jgi:ergothioneine biosynthesis protein EgtB